MIPAYNEEAVIGLVLDELFRLSGQLVLDVLVIDDGSADGTGIVARSKGAKVVENRKNTGYGAALRLGLLKAAETTAEVIVTMDADGSYSASDIPRLIQPILADQADIVIGSRFLVDQCTRYAKPPLTRRLAIGLVSWLVDKMLNSKLTDPQSGFRAFRRSVIPSLLDTKENGPAFLVESTLRLTRSRIVEVPARIRPRITRPESYLGIAQAWNFLGEAKQIWSLSRPGK